jgi:sugar-specific transcriptional regulator TrmB
LPSQDEAVQTLVKLGLTVLQAKVYIALAKLGTSTARTTAKLAQVASQDVYRVLADLQEKGLVEKIIAQLTMYKATPIKEGLSILLQNKKEEHIETEKQAKTIFNSFYENDNQNILNENVQFTITSKWSLLIKMHEKLADRTKKSIDFIIPVKMSKQMLFHNCLYIKRAIRRGVKIRAITQKVNGESMSRNPKPLSKNPLFELRYLPETSIPFGMHIFDKEEVTLAMSEKKPMPSLWTNNLNVVRLAEDYFENIWNIAQTKYVSADLPVVKQPHSSTGNSTVV